jgi:DNA-directed RNA polymerase subunit RPC12/RpoP
MVRIVKVEPHPTVVKEVVCRNCGATLEYVPKDIQSRQVSCMGDIDTYRYIVCPNCSEDLGVH